jgi:ubiquinol-cytochrome c reductase iron-sulfur subunit
LVSGAIEPSVKRRDFLYIATGAMATVGGLAALWPFIGHMEPGADVLSAGAPISIDLSSVRRGQQIVVVWRSMPIFIARRTPAMLEKLKNGSLLVQLREPNSEELQQPPYATNWSRAVNPEYLVVVGVCPHLGCIPAFTPEPGSLSSTWPGEYLCHCHGSKYDLAGRVFKEEPAPYNLPVPPFTFASATTLSIGENPKNEIFELSSVRQN